jgi:hypothetical protein
VDVFLKCLSVYLLSTLKFIFGPTVGIASGIPVVFTALLTAAGMMTTVYLFTYFSGFMKRFTDRFKKKDRKRFTPKSRRFVTLWKKYGIRGIAFLTPVILMPAGGAILANVLGGKKQEIIKWMWVSAIFWGFTISFILRYAVWLFHRIPFIKDLNILDQNPL